MAREKPALQAVYDLAYNKRPTITKFDRRSRTSRKLIVTPDGDRDEFEHPHSESVIDLLDTLGVTYRVETDQEEVDGSEEVTAPNFIKRGEALAQSLDGDDGTCTFSHYSGDITLETFAEFGPSKHIERRAKVEAFYAREGVGLDTGAITLDCRHIFSANVCKPLKLKTTAEVVEEPQGETELVEEGALSE